MFEVPILCMSVCPRVHIPVSCLPRLVCRSALLRLEGHSQGLVVSLSVDGTPQGGCNGLTSTVRLHAHNFCNLNLRLLLNSIVCLKSAWIETVPRMTSP